MKNIIKLLFLLCTLSCRQAQAQDQTFVGSTPCSEVTRPLPGIPHDRECELIKWELRLSGGPEAGSYSLFCSYGLSKQGTRGFINGGYQLRREGKWVLRKGVYRLDPDKPLESIAFRRLNENLIHLLDDHQQLMVGTGAWSYTLSKLPK
jgi:hypothetical protein